MVLLTPMRGSSIADIEDAARVAREKRREIYGEFAGVDR